MHGGAQNKHVLLMVYKMFMDSLGDEFNMKKKYLIIILITVLGIISLFIGIIIVKNNKIIKNDLNHKTIESQLLSTLREYDGLNYSGFTIVYENKKGNIYMYVTKVTNSTVKNKNILIELYDQNGKVIIKKNAYIDLLNPNESKTIVTSTDYDLSNVYDYKVVN